MAKKINLNGAKEFLFNHGEKVALGTCGFLALLFGVMGLMDAMSAGRSPDSGKAWADELKSQHDRLQQGLASSQPTKFPKETVELLKPEGYVWAPVSSDYAQGAYINIPEDRNDKRQNPRALAIRKQEKGKGPRYQQLDYVPALVYTYELKPGLEEVKILQPGGNGGPAFPAPGKKGMAGPGVGLQGGDSFLKAGDPRRMVVGYVVFPMAEQVGEFQRALKLLSQKEMFDAPREDLPYVLGFDLVKEEILPNGEPAKKQPEILLTCNGAKAPTISDKLKKFMSLAIYDDKSAAALEPYVFSGLTMPLPQLAYGAYPRVNLDGGKIQGAEELDPEGGTKPSTKNKPGPGSGKLPGIGPRLPSGKQPGMDKDAGKNEIGYTVLGMKRKDLEAGGPFEQTLASRLFDRNFFVYHAMGLKPADPGADNVGKQMQPGGPRGPGAQTDKYFDAWDVKPGVIGPDGKLVEGPGQAIQPGLVRPGGNKGAGGAADTQGAAFPNWSRDAVVRFIDIDVEPGKTYRYAIKVHLKNPNFNKPTKDVAYAALTKVEELVSEWEYTEKITIPGDYFLYAFDQKLHDDGKAPLSEAKLKDTTAFQIHQWTRSAADQDLQFDSPIGDWGIAERVLVHKGSLIGPAASVYVPYWVSTEDAFKLPKKPGIKIDMQPPLVNNAGNGIVGELGYPVLVDFIGGKRKVTPNSNADEEVAVDALIVGPDGKLRVLNSRDADENTPYGRDRQARVIRARDRADEASGKSSGSPNNQKKGSGNLPGFGGGN